MIGRPIIPSPMGRDEVSAFIMFPCGLISRVDDADVEEVRRWHWYLRANRSGPYARRHDREKYLSLHRVLSGANRGDVVDHVNGDTLDNRRANLRVCTRQQNGWNRRPNASVSHGFKGIQAGPSGRWYANIRLNGQRSFLGTFDTAQDAALAYDEAAAKHFGSFAYLNFPERRVL